MRPCGHPHRHDGPLAIARGPEPPAPGRCPSALATGVSASWPDARHFNLEQAQRRAGAGGVWIANPEGRHAVLRVRQGGEVAEAIDLETDSYAVMLGGPERRHLLICASNTHNPAEIAQSPSVTLRVIEVAVAGAGIP